MKKKESQKDLYNHSKVKVDLLKKYLQAYLTIIGYSQHFNVIHLFDLFCGEGLYPNGGKGSPLIITETIKEIKEKSKNGNLTSTIFNFHANDINNDSLNNVKSYLDSHKEETIWLNDLTFSNLDYKEIIPELSEKFNKLQGEKAFVFIDPYGYKDISIVDIEALLKGKNSEVLLFLPTQFMYRFDNVAAPPSLIKFISELNPSGDWQKSNNGLEFIDNLKDAFTDYLKREFYVDAFRIAKAKNEYFCLFFFTSHIYGFHKMVEAKWRIDKEGGRAWRPVSYVNGSGQIDLFELTEIEPQINPLENSLIEFLNVWRNNKELYEFTLRKGFLPKHANPILKRLVDERIIEIELVDSSLKRKSGFYLTYENYKPRSPIKMKARIIKN